ncbi:MAG: cytidine deaminase [Elusimicrobiota bacterium]|jgi:cytidine deaminase
MPPRRKPRQREDGLAARDRELVAEARRLVRARFRQNYHHLACALRTRAGRVFSGVHLEAYVGRVAVCAEAVALGVAASAAGDTDVDVIVTVDRNGTVVSPCGLCREMLTDFAPDARVVVPGNGTLDLLPVSDLLPRKYRRFHKD